MAAGSVSTKLRCLGFAALLASVAPTAAAQTSQTIAFDAIPNQIFGISPFPIAAQASSGLPVVIASTTPTICKTASGLVMLLKVGTCSITASQGGNSSYSPATSVTRNFTVSLAKTSGSFMAAPGSPIAAGTNPQAAAVGDFNGDGIPDIATVNYGSNNVTVLLGSASGGFTAAPGSPFPVGSEPESIAVGDFNGDGFSDIATANYGSNSVTVWLGSASGGFTAAPGSPFTVGTAPNSVAVGDFNSDGIADLAVVCQGSFFSQGSVVMLLGNGLGGFTPTLGSPYTVGIAPGSLAVADFNGDGFQDLAIANYVSGTVTVLLGDGMGGFTAATGSPFQGGPDPNFVVAGDFNGDGIPDLAIANYTFVSVTVMLGNGSGGFSPAPGSPFTVGWYPNSLVVGDFNGDGIADVASAGTYQDNITILLGSHSGAFTTATISPLAVGSDPTSIVVADFNGDGIEDLAIANHIDNNVTVLLGFAAGNTPQTISFATPGNVTYGAAPYTISATASSSLTVSFASITPPFCTVAGSTVTIVAVGTCTLVASQAGNTTYGAAATVTQTFTINQISQTITFGALNNVSLPVAPISIAATSNSGLAVSFASATLPICTVSVTTVTVLAPGTCSIVASQAGNTNYAPATPVTESFTVTGNPVPQTISFDSVPPQFLGISPFPIAARASSTLPISLVSTTPAVCKTSQDLVMLLGVGTCSIAAGQSGNSSYSAATPVTKSFTVSLAGPSNSFTAATNSPYGVGIAPYAVVVGDFNGDGIPDVATANYSTSNVTVLLGIASGGFTPAPGSPFGAGTSPGSIVVGDFDGDGKQDLAIANQNSNNVTVLLGNGAGGFAPAPGSPFPVGSRPESVAVGDFNGDGIQDLAVASYGSGTVTVLLGNGAGGFTATANPVNVAIGLWSVAVGDFNGDGNQDLAVANSADGYVAVLLGNGAGGFTATASSPIYVGTGPYSVVVGDFNGDGKQDLATANFISGNVTVLLGNGSGGFAAAAGSPFQVGVYPESLVVGDFNGDGVQDLAVANSQGNNVTVLLGNGSGGFTPEAGSPFQVGTGPQSVAVGDFNRDGIQDLAVANANTGNVTVLLGAAAGQTSQTITFGPLSAMPYGALPFAIAATASSGLAVSFATTTSTVCSVAGNTVTIAGVGACSIVATQTGNATYAPAASATQTFTVFAVAGTVGYTYEYTGNQMSSLFVFPFNVACPSPCTLTGQFTFSSPLAASYSGNTAVQPQSWSLTDGTVTLSSAAANYLGFNLQSTSGTTIPEGWGITACINSACSALSNMSSSGPTRQGSASDTTNQQGLQAPYYATAAAAGSWTLVETTSVTGGTGGPSTAPVPLPSGVPVLSAGGTIGGSGAQAYYAFQWPGGAFSATASITGANAGASYVFSEGAVPGCGSGQSATLSSANSFAATIAIANLTAGEYCIGLNANNSNDPAFTLTFNTPVAGVPSASSPQTITFDAIPNQIFGISPFPVEAEASSNLPVSFVSTTPAVCKNAADLVMLLSVGTCSIVASQGGNASYSAATPVTRSFMVSLATVSGTLVADAGSPFTAGATPNSVAIADFNGDGKPDLAIANTNDPSISILLGNGSGGFTAATNSPLPLQGLAFSVAVGDFNGDGKLDLAAGNGVNITVFLGDGTGRFTPSSGGPFAAGGQVMSIAVGDFNGDGKLDLAIANYTGNGVMVLLGDGAGGFTPSSGSPFAAGQQAMSVAVGDFNRDGKLDLAIANYVSSNVTVLLGDGAGGFTPASGSPLTVGGGAWSVAVGDFNGDGKLDLATANIQGNSVTVLLGDGSGGFMLDPGSPSGAIYSPTSVAVADINGDGYSDLAVANTNGVTVLLGNNAGGFTPASGSPFVTAQNPSYVAVGDLNGDGRPDLAVASYIIGSNVTVLLGALDATNSILSTASPLTIGVGQPVPLTLTVSGAASAFSSPTGTATFMDGNTVLGMASQTVSPYTFSAPSLGVGSHKLTATYSGDTRSLGSTSNSITIQVNAGSACNVTQTGSITVIDVQHVINEALGLAPAASDFSGDGSVTVVDVQIEANAALGLGCTEI